MRGVSLAGDSIDDPHERALANPDFASAVAAAHTGAWSVPDALWWELHPEDPAPSGTASPVATLRGLQRRAFSADGDAAGDAIVAAAVRTLEAEIAAERLAIAEAIRAAENPAVAVEPRMDNAVGAVDGHPDDAHGDALEAEDPHRSLVRRPWVLTGGALLAVALGVVLGSQLGAEGPVIGAAATPSATPAPSAAPTVSAESPSMILLREQTPQDQPSVSTGDAFKPGSFRLLASAGGESGVGTSSYYAAQSTAGMLCLVVTPADGGYLSTCALESGFPSVGLRLYWEGTFVFSESDQGPQVGDFAVAWQSDGTISSQWGAREGTRPGWEAE